MGVVKRAFVFLFYLSALRSMPVVDCSFRARASLSHTSFRAVTDRGLQCNFFTCATSLSADQCSVVVVGFVVVVVVVCRTKTHTHIERLAAVTNLSLQHST